jgi:hypothetical protein
VLGVIASTTILAPAPASAQMLLSPDVEVQGKGVSLNPFHESRFEVQVFDHNLPVNDIKVKAWCEFRDPTTHAHVDIPATDCPQTLGLVPTKPGQMGRPYLVTCDPNEHPEQSAGMTFWRMDFEVYPPQGDLDVANNHTAFRLQTGAWTR